MKTIKFILAKIVIVEVMLLVLYFAISLFNINIEPVLIIITTSLKYLTPIAIPCVIPYIMFSILDNRITDIIIGVVVGGLILYYILRYMGAIQ